MNSVYTSGEHPFWVTGKGWTLVKELIIGDTVFTINGGQTTISGLTYVPQPLTVYNITVGDLHSYFVGDSGILVHNKAKMRDPHKSGGGVQQVNEAAKTLKMTPAQRRAFGDFLEDLKQGSSRPSNVNFSWKELMELGKEFLGKNK